MQSRSEAFRLPDESAEDINQNEGCRQKDFNPFPRSVLLYGDRYLVEKMQLAPLNQPICIQETYEIRDPHMHDRQDQLANACFLTTRAARTVLQGGLLTYVLLTAGYR